MIIKDLEQRTPEWYEMRKGRVTASRVADAMSFLTRASGDSKKGDETARRRTYRHELVIEILTGNMGEHYVSDAMQWGVDNEPLARMAYELSNNIDVVSVGFAVHDKISGFGASPDCLVGDEGLGEIKCPTSATHLDYILAGVVPSEYEPQMIAEMACTGRQWVDFVSYDPRMPEHLRLFQRRFHRDEDKISEMEQAVVKFLAEVDELLERLKQDDPSSLEGVLRKSVEEIRA